MTHPRLLTPLLWLATAATLLTACAGDDGTDAAPGTADTEITVEGLTDDAWTYISLETGATVGRSAKDDPEADALWAARTDWDVAVCGDMIRTNSGTSGQGQGGLRRLDGRTYDDVTAADAATVDADRPASPDAPRQ